jgi:hypothetical protein
MKKILLKSSGYTDRWFISRCGGRWDKQSRRWFVINPSEKQKEKLAPWLPDDFLKEKQQ